MLPYPLVNDDWWESEQKKKKGHGNVVDTNSKSNQASVFPQEQETCQHYGWKFRRKEYGYSIRSVVCSTSLCLCCLLLV